MVIVLSCRRCLFGYESAECVAKISAALSSPISSFCTFIRLCSASAYFDSSSASSAGVGGRRPTVRLPNGASGGMPRSVSNGTSLQSVDGTIEEHDPEFFPSYHADLAADYAEINDSTPSPPAYLVPGVTADGDFNPYGQYDADDGERMNGKQESTEKGVFAPCVFVHALTPDSIPPSESLTGPLSRTQSIKSRSSDVSGTSSEWRPRTVGHKSTAF